MDEETYRSHVERIFSEIDRSFGDVDPDQAESSLSQGALTVVFAGGHRLILSPQPAVRQIWMAFRDQAWHFDRGSDGRWLDDRGRGIELFARVREIAKSAAGVDLPLGAEVGG